MNEPQYTDIAVRLPYTDQKHRGTFSRSTGRRAAHRGFKADIRHGQNEWGGFISVQRLERMEERVNETAGASSRRGRRSRAAAASEAQDAGAGARA